MNFMSRMYSLSFIAGLIFVAVSCGQREYDIDKTSANGIYRVKIGVRTGPPKGTREYTEHVKLQFFKRHENIYTHEWQESDQYEPSFHDLKPVVEWIDDNVLRLGDDPSDQPFNDEVIVSNNTDEYFNYLSVGYGRQETFWIFDLAPRSKVTLHASPGFAPNGLSAKDFLSYGGMTESGKKFNGVLESKQRQSPSEGPFILHTTVNPKALQ